MKVKQLTEEESIQLRELRQRVQASQQEHAEAQRELQKLTRSLVEKYFGQESPKVQVSEDGDCLIHL